MGEFPIYTNPHLTLQHPWSLESIGAGIISAGGTALNNAVSTTIGQDIGRFVPILITKTIIVKTMFIYNGSTVNGTIGLAIYDKAGVRLVLGSATQSGTSALQIIDITDTQIGPGLFYMAMSSTSATATALAGTVNPTGMLQSLGCFRDTSLPTTATFSAETGTTCFLFGIVNEATVTLV